LLTADDNENLHDQRSGPDNHSTSDSDAAKNDCLAADPGVVVDHNGLARLGKLGIVDSAALGEVPYTRRVAHVHSDEQAARSAKQTVMIYDGSCTNRDSLAVLARFLPWMYCPVTTLHS
jgi:hypothetical protein